jgi:hypothetical protein
MRSEPCFYGGSGTRYTFAEVADRIRGEAPHTLGKHIFEQLDAIGLRREFDTGTTPHGLPYTFAAATARYLGTRDEDGVVVSKEEGGVLSPLPWRLDLRDHSPTGPEWGYGGSGPAQLALAILADAVGGRAALDHYQDFKAAVVGGLPHDGWELSGHDVRSWFARHAEHRDRPSIAATILADPQSFLPSQQEPDCPGHRRAPEQGRDR